MRQRFILTIVFLALFPHCGQKSNPEDIVIDNSIIEGQGVGQFRLNETKLDDIIETHGNAYTTILYEDGRLEFNYKDLGLAFYYDSAQSINAIILRQPFSGETNKGIGLNSTVDEVLKAYGPTDWSTPCKTCDTWTARYKGIEFEIERDKALSKFPFNEGAHLKKKISKIFVYKTGT